MTLTRALLVSLLLATTTSLPSAARADETDDRQSASRVFRDAQLAFRDGAFRRAATLFEQANQLAPHAATLLNAAEAWERANEPARAADACEHVLEIPDVSREHREAASATLARLSPRVATLEVHGPIGARASVDTDGPRPVPFRRRLDPGPHLVISHRPDGTASKRTSVTASAGQLSTVDLGPSDDPPQASEPKDSPRTSPSMPPTPPALDQRPLGVTPASTSGPPLASFICFGTAALAVASGGLFGVRTLDAKDAFDARPTTDAADTFERERAVANVSWGIAAVAAASGLIIWLVSPRASGGAPVRAADR